MKTNLINLTAVGLAIAIIFSGGQSNSSSLAVPLRVDSSPGDREIISAPWYPFRRTGDRIYLPAPATQDCLAMSWDGRLMVCSHPQYPQVRITSRRLGSIKPGELTLLPGQSVSMESSRLILQADCNLVLTESQTDGSSKVLWASGTNGKCKTNRFRVEFSGGGNLVLYDDTTPIWSTVTSPYMSGFPGELKGGDSLALFAGAPYIAVLDENGNGIWTPTDSLTRVWVLRLFLPEVLTPTENPRHFSEQFRYSFSTTFPFVIPQGVRPENFPGYTGIDSSMLGSIAIVADPQYEENPYRSDARGNAQQTGSYLTYQMQLFAPIYKSSGGQAPLGSFKSTVIISNPYSDHSAVSSVVVYPPITPLKDTKGRPLIGIEPTLTADGQLLVYQNFSSTDFGTLYYSYNASPRNITGWTVPKPITKIDKDKVGELGNKKYPLSRFPILDGSGVAYDKPLLGAYPWLSLDGSELFFQAIQANDGGRRSGFSVVGSGTNGMVRHVDGGPNFTRDISRDSGVRRLTVISPGRSPGMWSPFEFLDARTLPLTDRPFSYPLFSVSGFPIYFDVSMNETLSGDYDLFLDMAEVINKSATYNLNRVQDISGNFHYGVKNAGAAFPEEAFPKICNSSHCPMNDPLSQQSNLFSGKAVYFNDQGSIKIKAKADRGHQLMKGAQDLTLTFAILPLRDFREGATNNYRSLLFKKNSFSLVLEQDRKLTFTWDLKTPNGKLTLRAPFWGETLPLNEWTHITFTFQSRTGILSYYVNGLLKHSQFFPESKNQALFEDSSPLIIGPQAVKDPASPALASFLYAMDQVGLSTAVSSQQEILRQAGAVVRRLSRNQLPNVLPPGILAKDINQESLLSRPLDSNKVSLGRELFFEPQLSANNQVSCSTCHQTNHAFAEPLSLHPNLLSSPAHLLRHTPGIQYVAMKSLFFWDGRSSSLSDQALSVLNNPQEMGPNLEEALLRIKVSSAYQNLFTRAFPGSTEPITPENTARALQEFQLSLILQNNAANSPFDRYRSGELAALNELENRGRVLFFGKARCSQCHTGSGLSDGLFHSLPFIGTKNQDGETDLGRFQATRRSEDVSKFATPSLRQISSSGPYFHNGSAGSLEEVVALYSSWTMNNRQNPAKIDESLSVVPLTPEEQAALVAFLKTLDSY